MIHDPGGDELRPDPQIFPQRSQANLAREIGVRNGLTIPK